MGFWDRLFGRQPASSKVAKDRLQLVLVQDRSGLSPETMEQIRDEIIGVLSKYVEIDRTEMDISLSQGRGQTTLVANIPFEPPRVARKP